MIKTLVMKNKIMILVVLFSTMGMYQAKAQCAAGEIEIELIVETDGFGYEGYWSLATNGACGVNEIANGGNNAVGCNGGGAKNQTPGGYGNNQVFSAGKWCVKLDTILDLHYVDDWGDGGFGFTVKANGYTILAVDGQGANETWSFFASEPPAIDGEMHELKTPYSYTSLGNNDVTGAISNGGKDTITTIDISYSVDGGSAQASTLSGLSLEYGEHIEFTHPTPINLTTGMHTIKVWTGKVNGIVDSVNTNDTIDYAFEVGPGIPNIIDDYLNVEPNKTLIGSTAQQLNKPTDLDFHPVLSKKELWVVNKRTESQGGSTVTFSNAGESNQTSIHRKDANSWHFMSLPTGIAFGENENFGTSPGVFDANHNGGSPFTGPALWSSDPAIYAQPSGGNGSHLDMLHNSPKCQGIAHEVDNVYWVFDGQSSDIVRYDFAEDHGPGATYHGDAIVHRYSENSVKMDPQEKVVSHLVLNKATNWLYIVDHGNQKVMRLDITSGTKGANANIYNFESVKEYKQIVGYTWETVVDAGLQKPSGIDIIEDRMIVSDNATGEILVYDISSNPAVLKGKIATGAQGIMGVKIGPNGKIWYIDYDANKVFRLDASELAINETAKVNFSLYPNPSNGHVKIRFTESLEVEVTILNVVGQIVYNANFEEQNLELNLDLTPGTYFAQIKDLNNGSVSVEKLIIQ